MTHKINKTHLLLILLIFLCISIYIYTHPLTYSIDRDGYMIVPNVLSHKECNNLLKIIKIAKKKKMPMGNIHSTNHREDRMIYVTDVDRYIKKIIKKTSHMWKRTLGNNPLICECSSLLSYPGSVNQIWHTDTNFAKNDAQLMSIGIALEDITEDMGPLHVFKGSHKMYKKDLLTIYNNNNININKCSLKEKGLCAQYISKACEIKGYKLVKCVAKKGDLVAWKSSIVHRGSGNISNKVRPVFYFSLLNTNGNPPLGSTYSLSSKQIHINDL